MICPKITKKNVISRFKTRIMKRITLVFILTFVSIFSLLAAEKEEVVVLYLLPFHLQDTTSFVTDNLQEDREIYNYSPFEMMSFWEGSLIAFQQFESEQYTLRVVVKDMVTDEAKLAALFEDKELINEVDLIVGPFYSSLFALAAEYCHQENIPIVNPFTSRQMELNQYPEVYKLMAPIHNIPAKVTDKILSQFPNYSITLWSDSLEYSNLKQAYIDCFTMKGIPFKQLTTLKTEPEVENVVIALFQERSRIVNVLPQLASRPSSDSLTLVFPKEWLNISNLDLDFYTINDLYYLTNYFVDSKDSILQSFDQEYVDKFHSPSQLSRFTYQGYDVAIYFISQILRSKDIEIEELPLLASRFDFLKLEDGGYENQTVRLVKIEKFNAVEVE